MTELQIAELRKLLREAPKEINLFREASADVVLTWKARDVLSKLLDEREALLEAAKRAQSVGEIKFKTNALASDVHDALRAAIAKAESP